MAFLLTAGAPSQLMSQNNQAAHLVEVGTHKMFLNCTGNAPRLTVILEAGTGDTSEVWSAVQTEVEKFANVCSYDRLGLGRSDKLAVAHTADEIVADLHGLLHAASIRESYVLVAHSTPRTKSNSRAWRRFRRNGICASSQFPVEEQRS